MLVLCLSCCEKEVAYCCLANTTCLLIYKEHPPCCSRRPQKLNMAKSSDVPMSTNGIDSQDAIAHISKKKHFEEVGTTLKNVPAYTPRRLRVITIGAGFSGLTLAHKFQHQHPELRDMVDHTIYESRNELGGTWLVNTYPGVVCDVPSHIYVSESRPIYFKCLITQR